MTLETISVERDGPVLVATIDHPRSAMNAVDGTLPVGPEEVAIVRRPYGDGFEGVLTVEVCGGVG